MEPLVTLDSVTIRHGIRQLVREVSLSVYPGESWAILGGNGAGKTVLTEAIAGLWRIAGGTISYPAIRDPANEIQIVSFESQGRVMERERRQDDTNILHGATDPGTSVRDYLAGSRESKPAAKKLIARFGLTEILDRGLRYLSTGEIRKTLLCGALLLSPRLLILDDPFEGLDIASREELSRLIANLAQEDHALLLVLGRAAEIPAEVNRLLVMDSGRPVYLGEPGGWRESSAEAVARGTEALPVEPSSDSRSSEALICMQGVSVSYGAKRVVQDVTWEARPGEVWHIIGPNGSGKTTLLSLIDGSNPKAYGQDLWLFGRRRGTGESVWEIKRKIGHVSADFHRNYPSRTTAIETVLSGFTDTAGLYQEPSGLHVDIARRWLAVLELSEHEETPLRRLSFGQQRSLLVARAMVKMPPILIADEPTQGLDDDHSHLVLRVLERIGAETPTLLLYVSHDPTQRLDCTTHRMVLEPDPQGSRAIITP